MSEFSLMIHWNLSTNLKLSSKNVWGNVFSYVKVCLFWKSIQYSIHWDKTQVLKNFPPDKWNGTKNVVCFLSQVPVYHSFTFNLKFLYDLKRKVCLSKTVSGIFHFWLRFVFIKVYIFQFLLKLKKKIEKPHTVLLPELWISSWNKKF